MTLAELVGERGARPSRSPAMTHDAESHGPKSYSAADARQGDIVLRSRRRRAIFIAGLAGMVLLPLLLLLLGAGP